MPSHELDRHMRSRENEIETVIEEGAFLVVRLDGRGFTRLTEALGFSKPFDDAFHRHMVETARHLMGCGFPVLYGYTQSDEISLVLDPYHGAFGRRVQKTVSVLAGESSASFSLALGTRPCSRRGSWRFGSRRRWWTTSAGVAPTLFAMPGFFMPTGCCAGRARIRDKRPGC